ncbi:MAG: hypothetical protein SGPRY_011601, partial [Prymnesium sp.]
LLTYRDAAIAARSAIRFAREAARVEPAAWNRLLLQLPLPPPGCTLDSMIAPEGEAWWPGGVTQRHRVGLRPMVDELLRGYEVAFRGTIDVGQMGVWSLGSDLTAVGFVADLSFRPFVRLVRGEFGPAPTRDDHTLLLLNPRLTSPKNIGQPWERALRREAKEVLDEGGWRWIYAVKTFAQSDGRCAGVMTATCTVDEGKEECNQISAFTIPDGRLVMSDYCYARTVESAFDQQSIIQGRTALLQDAKQAQ